MAAIAQRIPGLSVQRQRATPSGCAARKVARLLLCCSLLSTHSIRAQTEEAPAEQSPDLGLPPEQAAKESVRLVAIGTALEPHDLRAALGEPTSEVDLTIDQRTRFDAAEFLSRARSGHADVEIWVDATDPTRLQLYFVDRRTARYALRTLTLSGTMNEMDLEALAQAISLSLRALRGSSSETLGPTEAAAKLDQPDPRASPTPSPADPSTTRIENAPQTSRSEQPRQHGAARGWWSGLVLYGATVHSSELGIVHGPGLGATVESSRTSASWGAQLTAQLQLPQTHADQRVRIELTTLASRLGARFVLPQSARFRWGAVAGLGLDTAWIVPESGEDPAFVVAAPSAGFLPLAYASLLAELRAAEHLRIELSLGLEADFFSVHYDIIDEGVPEPVVTRFPVRPTLTITSRFP